MTTEDPLAFLDGLEERLLTPKAPPKPKLKLVSDAPVKLDLDAMRQTNRDREARLLAEERREMDEAHQQTVEFCRRRNIPPPLHPMEARRVMREQRQEEDRQLRWQQRVDYHGEMKLFHESAEAEFRANDPLGLWR